jgi:YQGE family putative transporter
VHSNSGKRRALQSRAWLVILLNAFYSVADALCSVFVSVYFYVNSLDVTLVFQHYTTLYITTPIAFIAAGWYAKTRDRTHVFRIGLMLHVFYYALLLYLRTDAVRYVVPLGVFFGVTWGFFWAGNNIFQFDFSTGGKSREYFLGLISSVSNGAKMVAPFISGAIIRSSTTPERGYHLVFFLALMIYLAAVAVSFFIPHIRTHRPFRIRKALLPRKAQHDWRLIMLASASLAGSFHIFHFLLAILMYRHVANEAAVGGYVSFQGLVTVVTAFIVGKYAMPHLRSRFMFWGVVTLVVAGAVLSCKITVATMLVFALLRSISLPLFGIPHTAIRFEVMRRAVEEPSERIEYICAWEVPLAIGRIIMMSAVMLLYYYADDAGLRAAFFLLCCIRIVTYLLVQRVSFVHQPELADGDGFPVFHSDMGQTEP